MTLPASTTNRATPRGEATNSRGKKAAATTGLDTDTGNSSTAGQRDRKVARDHWKRRAELGRRGYRVAGLSNRIKVCGHAPVLGGGEYGLGVSDKGNLVKVGLSRCGKRHCEHCWGRITAERAKAVQAVVEHELALGNVVCLDTLTSGHATAEKLDAAEGNLHEAVSNQALDELIDLNGIAFTSMYKGRSGQALRAAEVGYARAAEITVDNLMVIAARTGAHWHYHVLYVLKPVPGLTPEQVMQRHGEQLWKGWERATGKVGMIADRKGFDMQLIEDAQDAADVAEYLAKVEKVETPETVDGFTAEQAGKELVRSTAKNGKGEHRVSPEQVKRNIGEMDEAGLNGDRRMRRLVMQWREIETATAGKNWLTWSTGERDLRKRAGLGEERTDEEIAQDADADEVEQVVVVKREDVKDYEDELDALVAEVEGDRAAKLDALTLALFSLGISYYVQDIETFNERIRVSMRGRGAWQAKDRGTDLEAFQPEP